MISSENPHMRQQQDIIQIPLHTTTGRYSHKTTACNKTDKISSENNHMQRQQDILKKPTACNKTNKISSESNHMEQQ